MPDEAREALNRLNEYFAAIPWVASLLRAPGTVTFFPASRMGPERLSKNRFPSHDELFKHTLDTDSAVPHCLGFYQDPIPALHSADEHPDLPFVLRSSSLLFDLRPGINGYNGTAHGGFIAAMIDEAMGSLIFQNDLVNAEAKAKGALPPDAQDFRGLGYFTARLEVAYRRPIPTPSIVFATASLKGVEGKKAHFQIVVKGENGEEYAVGSGTWIKIQRTKL